MKQDPEPAPLTAITPYDKIHATQPHTTTKTAYATKSIITRKPHNDPTLDKPQIKLFCILQVHVFFCSVTFISMAPTQKLSNYSVA